ncbi:luciferase-like monooxygenase family protein [Mycobacterium ulcerans str. Harvey]|uniref:Luciferase-like monooxygenase family protein n=1 Tax=Mycobacterium ulcerans str. Harvey TaxID=1299332 RepID=A0ABN0QWQ6_MYCUL|nr:luciferase-like monooxygenase family protein [Mycobacterium ulcerans str. Harvey]
MTRSPAKEAASIDLISGGRFVFGVGAGWNIEELRDHGTDPKTRGALLDERIEAIKALWTDEPAEYHGKYVDFPRPTAGPSRCGSLIRPSTSAVTPMPR